MRIGRSLGLCVAIAVLGLLFTGCNGEVGVVTTTTSYPGGYYGPYYGGYGPYGANGFGYVGGVVYRPYYGYHHFYGDGWGYRHFRGWGYYR